MAARRHQHHSVPNPSFSARPDDQIQKIKHQPAPSQWFTHTARAKGRIFGIRFRCVSLTNLNLTNIILRSYTKAEYGLVQTILLR